jgi:hypothetical protein
MILSRYEFGPIRSKGPNEFHMLHLCETIQKLQQGTAVVHLFCTGGTNAYEQGTLVVYCTSNKDNLPSSFLFLVFIFFVKNFLTQKEKKNIQCIYVQYIRL